MPPFLYSDYENRLAGSIADTMARRGDIIARGDERIGSILATRAQQQGALWGRAFDQTATAIGQAPQQTMQLQAMDTERKARQLQFDQAQRADQYLKTATGIMQRLGPNVSADQAQQALIAAGIPPQMHETILKPYRDMAANAKEARADAAAMGYQLLKALPDGADVETRNQTVAAGLGAAMAHEIVSPASAKAITQALASGQDPRGTLLALMGQSPSGRYKDLVQDEMKPLIVPGAARPGAGAATVMIGGRPVATGQPGGQAPVTPASLATTAAGVAPGAAPTPDQATAALGALRPDKPEVPKAEANVVYRDAQGVERPVTFKDGKYWYNGQDVSTQVRRPTPSSVIVQNMGQQALSDLPDWSRDSSRPAPTARESNVVDPKVGWSPNGLFQAAVTNIATGQMPQSGRGADPASRAKRAAVESKVGAIASAAGMDVPTLRSQYQANASSIKGMQTSLDAASAFLGKADKDTVLLEQSLQKLPDAGAPILNKPIRSFLQEVGGSADISEVRTRLQTVRNEFARIITQMNLGNVLSDSARQEGEKLLPDSATVGQILSSLRALRQEGDNRVVSFGEGIRRILSRTQALPGPGGPAGPDATDPLGIRKR